jgi:hypothetical protein
MNLVGAGGAPVLYKPGHGRDTVGAVDPFHIQTMLAVPSWRPVSRLMMMRVKLLTRVFSGHSRHSPASYAHGLSRQGCRAVP